MATKIQEIANPQSCFNRAESNEPIFVLRANDPMAANIVTEWAEQYAVRKGGISRMDTKSYAKYKEAHELAARMRTWKRPV